MKRSTLALYKSSNLIAQPISTIDSTLDRCGLNKLEIVLSVNKYDIVLYNI